MKRIKVRLSSEFKTSLKVISVMLTLLLATLPQFIYFSGHEIFKLEATRFAQTSLIGSLLFVMSVCIIFFSSRFSPVKLLRIRKKLMLFTEQLTKQTQDGNLKHSVEWLYKVKSEKIVIELYSNGLVSDKQKLGGQLSEFLRENLLQLEQLNDRTRFIFGEFPRRLNGKEVLKNDKL